MKKEFLFEEFPRHYRKQHKGISQPSWRQGVLVRIIENQDYIFNWCIMLARETIVNVVRISEKTYQKQASSNFQEKKKKAKKGKKKQI